MTDFDSEVDRMREEIEAQLDDAIEEAPAKMDGGQINEIDYDAEVRARMAGGGKDLYRVGEPSIGESWPRRFSYNRSTGGIGTGVYAFRDRDAAQQNIDRKPEDAKKDLLVLRSALTNPITPRTEEATRALNKFGRQLAGLASFVNRGDATWDEVTDRGGSIRVEVRSGFGTDPGLFEGDSLSRGLLDVLLNTPELRDEYGLTSEDLAADGVRAARMAQADLEASSDQRGLSQPLNYLLWPRFDGVCPSDSAGGNTGEFGCVILVEKIEQCFPGQDLSFPDQVGAQGLNECFQG